MPATTAPMLLAALQSAVTRKDVVALGQILDDEVVLFGTAAENLNRAQTEAYLARVLAQPGTLRWDWNQILPLCESSEVLAFAVVGTVGFDDVQGQPEGPRSDFRLTCVAVSTREGWRLRHFHGSVPEAS